MGKPMPYMPHCWLSDASAQLETALVGKASGAPISMLGHPLLTSKDSCQRTVAEMARKNASTQGGLATDGPRSAGHSFSPGPCSIGRRGTLAKSWRALTCWRGLNAIAMAHMTAAAPARRTRAGKRVGQRSTWLSKILGAPGEHGTVPPGISSTLRSCATQCHSPQALGTTGNRRAPRPRRGL